MGYVAVSGGEKAIDAAEQLLDYYRLRGQSIPVEVTQIKEQMRLAVDRVMGEGGLYAPELAALAIKQAEGDLLEASFLVRAFRATQARKYDSVALDTRKMQAIRRISATFQDLPGGQLLGPTRDYTQRLLDFSLLMEDRAAQRQRLKAIENQYGYEASLAHIPRAVESLQAEGLIFVPGERDSSLSDVTRESLHFPCPRSAKLQSLARGDTGAMMALAYSVSRGWGEIHPYIAELRVGYVPVYIDREEDGERVYLGRVLITEAEVIAARPGDNEARLPEFELGYGLCMGHNEIKAISMGILDISTRQGQGTGNPAEDEEFVLYHIDGIEASGFVAHWKLPHYVTFQSSLDRLRKIREEMGETTYAAAK